MGLARLLRLFAVCAFGAVSLTTGGVEGAPRPDPEGGDLPLAALNTMDLRTSDDQPQTTVDRQSPKSGETSRLLARLFEEFLLDNARARDTLDLHDPRQQQQQLEQKPRLLPLLKRNRQQQQQQQHRDQELGGKRAGDRRCLYHAVNCW